MAELKTSLRGLAEIAGHEGIVPYPYRDSAGVWTFGIGHTAAAGLPDPADLPKGEAKPLRAVFELFAKDIERYETRVRNAVKVPLTQTQFEALVSFDFNTGGIHRAKLTRALNDGDFAGAARAFDGWRKPVEIIPRRNAEKALFRDGTYSHNGRATVYPADAEGRVQWYRGERVNVLALLEPTQSAQQPDDPGPETVTSTTIGLQPRPPFLAGDEQFLSPPDEGAPGRVGSNAIRVAGGLIAGAALWALRKPIKGLFGWLADGTPAQKVASIILLVIAVGALAYALFGDF